MPGPHTASEIEALVRDVERARDQCGSRGLTVLLDGRASAAEKEALVAIAGVTVVCSGGRTGLQQEAGPQPRSVLVRGDSHGIAIRKLLELYRSGARFLVEPEGLRWHRRSLARYISYRLAREAAVRTVVTLDRLDSRIQAHAAGPVGKTAGRALGGMRRLLVGAKRLRHGRDLTAGDLDAPAILETAAFEPQRVLMINSALAWGGAERQLVNTMVGLQRRGWDVRLACENLGRVPDSDFFAPELQRRGLSYGSLGDLGRAARDWLLESALSGRIEERLSRLPVPFRTALWPYVLAMLEVRPGTVHAWQDQTTVMAGVAAALVGVPRVVLFTRNMAPYRFAYHQPYMRPAYRVLSGLERVRLVNNSHAGAADYARWLGLAEESFMVIHNGFDFDALQAAAGAEPEVEVSIPPGAPLVGSIFRFYAEKDPGLWVSTAARVAEARPDCHFLIVGTGPLRGQARDLARRYGIADRVHLPGALKTPSVLLRRISAFLLTSRLEGLPNVLVEAQALGIPVIATAAGGSAETFVDGETGWLVEERAPATLAARVVSVLEDQAWTQRCRLLAPKLARERFGIDRMLDETIALYASGFASVPQSAAPLAR